MPRKPNKSQHGGSRLSHFAPFADPWSTALLMEEQDLLKLIRNVAKTMCELVIDNCVICFICVFYNMDSGAGSAEQINLNRVRSTQNTVKLSGCNCKI